MSRPALTSAALALSGLLALGALSGCATPSDELQGSAGCTGDASQWMHADPGLPVRCGPQSEDPMPVGTLSAAPVGTEGS